MTFFNVNCPLMLAQVNWFQWAVACPHCPFSTVFHYRFITTEKTEFNDLNPMNGESNESSESDEWWIQCIQWVQWIQWIVNPVNPMNDGSSGIFVSKWVNCFQWWSQWNMKSNVEVSRPVPGRKFRHKGRLPVQGLRTRLQERIA